MSTSVSLEAMFVRRLFAQGKLTVVYRQKLRHLRDKVAQLCSLLRVWHRPKTLRTRLSYTAIQSDLRLSISLLVHSRNKWWPRMGMGNRTEQHVSE